MVDGLLDKGRAVRWTIRSGRRFSSSSRATLAKTQYGIRWPRRHQRPPTRLARPSATTTSYHPGRPAISPTNYWLDQTKGPPEEGLEPSIHAPIRRAPVSLGALRFLPRASGLLWGC